jgi:transglutaminase-like putative cysteine protease
MATEATHWKRRRARPAPRAAGGVCLAIVAVLSALALLAPDGALAIGLGSEPDIAAAQAALSIDRTEATAAIAAAEAASGLSSKAGAVARADAICRQARAARRAHLFTRATALYDRARDLYLEAGAARKGRACLTAMYDIALVAAMYPSTRAEMLAALSARFPDVPAAERAAWLDLPSTERMRWDGVVHFFYDLPTNLAYRDLNLFQTQPAMVAGYRQIYDLLTPYLAVAAATPAWEQYGTPKTYAFTQTLSVPRDQLPANGDLRIWFPLPIETGPQTGVRITGITPAAYVRYPPSISQSIGLLYMRVPLAQLGGNLDETFDVGYSHAAQYFKVVPSRVGRYDTSSALYRRYTTSRGNTRITPSIRATARRVVDGEKNPYLAARRLYAYVVNNVKYSHMPHLALWPRGEAESVYVHRHKYGDCGAQGIYFSALCRATGIPARCTGGYQTFSGRPGAHFWAEFYLPNYGWLPVDPTVATIADYVPELSTLERQAFHAFYFANQDDLRLVVQKDVDLPLIPRATERVLIPMVIQMPAALCDTMTQIPGVVVSANWTFE